MTRIILAAFLFLQSGFSHADSLPAMTRQYAHEITSRLVDAGLPKAFQSLKSLNAKQSLAALDKLTKTQPAQMSAHVSHTLLFLLVVTGVDIVKSSIKEGDSQADISEQATQAAWHIVNNGSVYLAIFGAGAATWGSAKPVAALENWMVDTGSRPILARFLKAQIIMAIATGAWEGFRSLWNEAAMLLETPEEFERSRSLFGMGAGAIRALVHSNDLKDKNDLNLAIQMSKNIFMVSLWNQDLRSRWVDNFIRTSLFSGETILMSAAIASAGLVAVPGGNVAAFLVGVVAVVAVHNLPSEVKDSITRALHSPRRGTLRGILGTYEIELRDATRRKAVRPWQSDMIDRRLAELLKARSNTRSSYLTVEFERMRMVLKQWKEETLTQDQAHDQMVAIFSDLGEFFHTELTLAKTLEQQEEFNRIQFLSRYFQEIIAGLEDLFAASKGRLEPSQLSSFTRRCLELIEVAYARGFREAEVFESSN